MGSLIARRVAGRRFDSNLDTDIVSETRNAELVLKVRTRVQPCPLLPGNIAHDYDHVPHRAVPLSESDVARRWDLIKEKTESTWNDKLWLIPDPPLEFHHVFRADRTRAICPFIRCVLLVVPCPEGATPHLTINVVQRVNTSVDFRSSAGNGEMTLDDEEFLSSSHTIAHEMGHHIGLAHVHRFTEACLTHPDRYGRVGDDNSCYGIGEPWTADNVMGAGLRVEAWNSWPWRSRMNQHWDIGHDWRRDPPPAHTRDLYHEPRGRPRPRVIQFHPVERGDADPVAGVRDLPDGGV